MKGIIFKIEAIALELSDIPHLLILSFSNLLMSLIISNKSKEANILSSNTFALNALL
jgi:hypothetical protein